jgi:hypothetical protein
MNLSRCALIECLDVCDVEVGSGRNVIRDIGGRPIGVWGLGRGSKNCEEAAICECVV